MDSPAAESSTPNSVAATAGTPNEKPQFGQYLHVDEDSNAALVGSPLKKQRSSLAGLEGTLQSHNGDDENGLEIPASAFAGFNRTVSASTTASGQPETTQGQGSSIGQGIAAATALPDEDEEL